uniref:Ig-like domain-containing protein n=1 Tax=Mola mola TaxID=94237 RepID=A0A3Q4AYL2_MOLML
MALPWPPAPLSETWRPAAAPLASTVQVRVGEDATLQCPLLDIPAGAVLSWYRRAVGHGPELLLSIRSTGLVTHGPGVGPDKVSAAADGSLLLRASQRSDAAVYYCSVSRAVV